MDLARAAVVLAGWLIARRHKQARWFQVGELVAIAAAVLIGVGMIQLPNFEQLLEDAGQALGKWTYLAVGLLAFLETGAFLGFIAPGETAVIVGGLVAGQGEISLLALIAIVWACCVAGDVTSYELGRRLGPRLAAQARRAAEGHRGAARSGRGLPGEARRGDDHRRALPRLRAAADAVHRRRERMPLRRFLPYDVLAAGLWSITFCVLGFVFWRSIDQLTTYVSRGLFAFGTLVVVVGGIVALIHLRRSPEARAKVREFIDERDDRPGWKQLAKIARPVWHMVLRPAAAVADFSARFTTARVTPATSAWS